MFLNIGFSGPAEFHGNRGVSAEIRRSGRRRFTPLPSLLMLASVSSGGEFAAVRGAEPPPIAGAASMRRVVAGLTPGDSGRFFGYDGSPLLW
jgi:hypothetical protein